MKRYIDKDALVAEIERQISAIDNYPKLTDTLNIQIAVLKGNKVVLTKLLSFLDTIEVKEVDLENSMTCEVGWYDGFLLDYTQEQQDELLKKIGANVGDKIRVILIKE